MPRPGYPRGVKPKRLRGVPIKAEERKAKRTHLVSKSIGLRRDQVLALDALANRWGVAFAQAARTVLDWGLEEEREK